jgi:hypothetical protein
MPSEEDPRNRTPETSIDLRGAIVTSLVRSLFGPSEALEGWLGPREPKVLAPGASYEEKRPIGPYVDSDGNEVLPVNPRNIYLTGVLWGSHGNEVDSGEPTQEEPDPEDVPQKRKTAAKNRREEEVEASEHDDQDREEVAEDVDRLGRRRAIAFSIRIPRAATKAVLNFSFGTYRKASADFSGKSQDLWFRQAHQHRSEVDLGNNSESELTIDARRIRVVVKSRPDSQTGTSLVTISVANETSPSEVQNDVEGALFQFEASLVGVRVLPYAAATRNFDSLDLLYRNIVDLAIGHGTDVAVDESTDGFTVRTVAIPTVEVPAMTPDVEDSAGKPLAVKMNDLASMTAEAVDGVNRLISEYRSWIRTQESALAALDEQAAAVGRSNLDKCLVFLAEIETGWNLVLSNDDVARCLKDASGAMHNQRIGANAPLRKLVMSDTGFTVEGSNPHVRSENSESAWRPFQIAFILASIPKIFDDNHEARQNVDVIWMPTGGGKTEAYLGLAAFTILWERLKSVRAGEKNQMNTKVLMRYTLRLLTAQQFVRASALICALELTRAANPSIYGQTEIRIGTWVGRSTTPNKRKDAVAALKVAQDGGDAAPFLLTRCPWCGAEMGVRHPSTKKIAGYQISKIVGGSGDKRILATCPDKTCPFTEREITIGNNKVPRGLPVLEVDEDVYAFRPDFVVGTVDKAAMMWDQEKASQLFGISADNRSRSHRPPALLIQDELHLITGPLGSLDGAFEMLFDHLCATDSGVTPLIVASTATTRNFESQAKALYNRESKLVPPPALDFDDSFFSKVDDSKPSRLYVGICSSGGTSAANTQAAVVAALAHFPAALVDPQGPLHTSVSDAYWTNLCFFSSRSSLGTLFALADRDIPSMIDVVRRAGGGDSGSLKDDGSRYKRRFLANPREITATSSENVTDVLDDLSIARPENGVVDLCFATSMIEVGLDVPRLGLMTVIGQPKSASQYIQVTGRVGRSPHAPALVVDVLGTRTPRDRSHYEHFTSFHRRLYASVEGASVTPFSLPALERTLPAIAAILCRNFASKKWDSADMSRIRDFLPTLESIFVERARAIGGDRAVANTKRVFADLLQRVDEGPDSRVWYDRNKPEDSFLLTFGTPTPHPRTTDFWNVITSLRSVDPDALAHPIMPTSIRPAGPTSPAREEEII